ncbi:hypothetical protein GEV29_13190 [Aeromicrobium sp. SMF47]|uniref:Uncharacterized protein n=1 Tax=Aeromicrobium yanjiei TaxID=2662028 RepID=A0A5Q2MLY3_9ACTN|nr:MULTISPECIES: universal stress protein [Aeromicrobium]MRJ77496.1 hypothetical protein [Aeromicrobium yanjiei]MRK01863.1 hypothetical protein [Aeromicrobium sp. S22]QGG41395.1 hypothetical protein GEV26_08495 [Aeromicrobium yanjiei]
MNLPANERPVVVGVRDQQPGVLDFARELARLYETRLRVVHACQIPYPYAFSPLSVGDLPDSIVTAARKTLTDAEKHLEADEPQPDIAYELVAGFPPAVLGSESDGAKSVVVGTDDVGWLDRLTGEAVTNFLVLHAHSPVIVVPPGVDSFEVEQIIVAVDTQTSASGPVQFAFELADKISVDLRVLHVMRHREAAKDIEMSRVHLAEVLAGWSETYPDLNVTSELIEGKDPADETLAVAGDGALVVAGRPHSGALRGWRAPVARALARAGRRPVAVVPPDYTV